MSRYDISSWQVVSSDDRREIREFTLRYLRLSFNHFTIKAAIPLGNHYHRKKTEVFFLEKGTAVFTLQPLCEHDGTVIANGALIEVPMALDAPFTVAPFTAHKVVLEPGSEMVCISTELFDQDDMIVWRL